MAAHWETFIRDAGAAFAVWRRFPLLPLITLGLTALSSGFIRWLFFLALVVWILQIGWVGTERIWYLRGYRGMSLAPREALRFTRAFFGRYLGLALATIIPTLVILLPSSILASLITDDPQVGQAITWAVSILLLDVFLTFVTPALAFTTSNVADAFKIGWRMLREGWPGTAWYALFPPMAVLALTYSRQPEDFEYDLLWISASCLAALINLLAKGAVAAFYLRQHDTGNDGSAFEKQAPAADETPEDTAQQALGPE